LFSAIPLQGAVSARGWHWAGSSLLDGGAGWDARE